MQNLGTRTQIAFVVRDMDVALRSWTRVLGVGPFVVIENPMGGGAEFLHRGRPTAAQFQVAFSYIGELMVELIQPTDHEPSIYKEFLDAGREGLHHFAFWPDDFTGACEQLDAGGLEKVSTIAFPGQPTTVAYYQGPADLGAMLEIVEMTAARRRYYTAIRALANGWDGRDPVRRFKTYGDYLATLEPA